MPARAGERGCDSIMLLQPVLQVLRKKTRIFLGKSDQIRLFFARQRKIAFKYPIGQLLNASAFTRRGRKLFP